MYYSFKNNGLEYEEIKNLLSVKQKKEIIERVVIKGIIEQEYAVDYDVNYYRANYRRCERVQEIDYVKYKPNLINDEYREVEIVKIIDDNKAEFCKIIDDNKVQYCEAIEDRKAENCQLIKGTIESYELIKEETIKSHEIIEEEIIESCGLIEDKEDNNQLIEDKMVEKNDAHQLIKEIIESCELIEDHKDINKLNEYLEIIFNKIVEITFIESPFKSLISDIRSILPKDGHKKLKKHLKYIRELRKLTTLEIKNVKNELIKIKNKKINRNKNLEIIIKKNKFYGVKDIRNLFDDDADDDDDDDDNEDDDDDDDDDDIYEEIEYFLMKK